MTEAERPNQLGKNLQKLRKKRGVSRAELARLSSLDEASLWRIENGKRMPSLESVAAIVASMPGVYCIIDSLGYRLLER